MSKKPATKAESDYMGKVAQLSCLLCGLEPAEVHHIREGQGGAQRASHFLTVPLCRDCHRGKLGVHGDKTLLRIHKKTELDLLAETIERVFR